MAGGRDVDERVGEGGDEGKEVGSLEVNESEVDVDEAVEGEVGRVGVVVDEEEVDEEEDVLEDQGLGSTFGQEFSLNPSNMLPKYWTSCFRFCSII